jgi:DNA mismatch endonuclease, patch repair protein
LADSLSTTKRSWNMSRIRNKDTAPEKRVRSCLHRMGHRFRLHAGDLPGKPDIVLPKYRTAVFVNGCFWHRHRRCKFAYTPKSRVSFWVRKFEQNVKRDRVVAQQVKRQGWQVVVVWECQTSDDAKLRGLLKVALSKSVTRKKPA